MDMSIFQFLTALFSNPFHPLKHLGLTAAIDTEQPMQPVQTTHLEDGFITPRARSRSCKQSFGTNSNCSYGDTHIVEVRVVSRRGPGPLPLTPRVTVTGRGLESHGPDGEEVEVGSSSSEADSEHTVDVAEQYPQFTWKSMTVQEPQALSKHNHLIHIIQKKGLTNKLMKSICVMFDKQQLEHLENYKRSFKSCHKDRSGRKYAVRVC